MRCASWNVNGIRAVLKKEIVPWQVLGDNDVICLQETKAQPEQLPTAVVTPPDWHGHWHSAEKKGYASVAIFTREKPDEVVVGLGQQEFDAEGRVLAVRFGKQVIVSAYFPNSQDQGRRLAYKLDFCASMEKYLAKWKRKKCQVLLAGDYNIAHQPIDLARPKPNEKNAGYLPEERAWFSRYLKLGYRDVFRERNPELAGAYTWWSYRAGARGRNVGWRLDYTSTSADLGEAVRAVQHHPDILGSDHCPISVEWKDL